MKEPKTIEVEGITLTIEPSFADDFEFVECIAIMSDPEATTAEQAVATVNMMRRVFGADYARVKRELREAHGGALTNEVMQEFFSATLARVNAKNS